MKDDETLKVAEVPGVSKERQLADVALDPLVSGAALANSFSKNLFGSTEITAMVESLQDRAQAIRSNKLGSLEDMLTGQAAALNALFVEMARRSGVNLGEYMAAAEIYMKLALKAQSQCRATLEALGRLHQPREQTVRHVHVNEGGQAVVADNFHQHTGGDKNGKSANQSHATGAAGECASLPCSDPLGNGMPVTGRERKATMQDARREESGSP